MFNTPTVFTDPSGQVFFIPLLIIGGFAFSGAAFTAGYAAYESYQTTGALFNGEIWGAALWGLGEGFMASVDGFIPFADPFAYFEMYGPNDPILGVSATLGQVSRDILLFTLCFPTAKTLTTWCRNPILYEIGSTTVPPRVYSIIKEMSVLERGRYLLQTYGWRAPFLGAGAVREYLTTVPSGLTPGGALLLIFTVETLDYFF